MKWRERFFSLRDRKTVLKEREAGRERERKGGRKRERERERMNNLRYFFGAFKAIYLC